MGLAAIPLRLAVPVGLAVTGLAVADLAMTALAEVALAEVALVIIRLAMSVRLAIPLLPTIVVARTSRPKCCVGV